MNIAIIGGGAAGLMAAARIAELFHGHEIFLIERNKNLGKKIVISGGGRCNLTSGLTDLKEILSKYPRGSRFLSTAMYAFPPSAMREWIENHGVALKTESDMRVFPKSDNGMHVVRVFEKILEKSGAEVLFGTSLKNIKKDGDKFVLSLEGRDELKVDKVILCTGGKAYGHTGSTGDGYDFAKSLGHQITKLAPSLSALLLSEKWTRAIAGLSFKNANLSFRGKEKYSFCGAFMFTHKGVTGPAIFALSAMAAFEEFDHNKPAKLLVDFFPEMDHAKLTGVLKNEIDGSPKKLFVNILGHFVPKSFAEVLLKQLEIDAEKKNSELSKKELNKIVDLLKNMPLAIVGRVNGDEFVTAGGVSLKEVDPKTMESKVCPGLYFAGEILDYDGFTGGFNLQAAWSTGRLAGEKSVK